MQQESGSDRLKEIDAKDAEERIDPRAFDGIQPGSLAEFDMLKKTLREEAGNKVKVGASRKKLSRLSAGKRFRRFGADC